MCCCCRCFILSALFTIVGLAILIIGLIMAFSVFDILIDDEIRERTMLRNGTGQYDRWVSPDPATLNIYFFHVTNPADVTNNGARPIVEERGPYVYRMQTNRQNIVIDTDGDTLSYAAGRTLVFDAAASEPLLQTNTITMLNVPLQSAQQYFEMQEQMDLFNLQWRLAFGISDEDTSPLFHTVTVENFLFAGVTFCTNPLATPFCNSMRTNAVDDSRTLRPGAGNSIVFSFFPSTALNDGTFLITGGLNSDDVGNILRWNGQQYLTVWDGPTSACNRIRGTDGTIFHPFNDQDTQLDVFYPDVCRIFNLEFDGQSQVNDVDAYRYTLKSQVFAHTSVDRLCHCINITKTLDGENECLPNGFEDMYTCYGSHLVLSLPHLLWADADYASTVQGLSPNESIHQSYADLLPRLGATLGTARRLQFNMLVRNNTDLTSNVDPGVMPIFWFEEISEITEELIEATITDFTDWTYALEVTRWFLIAFGGAVTVVSFVFCLCCR